MPDHAYRPLTVVLAGQPDHELTAACEHVLTGNLYVSRLTVVSEPLQAIDADLLVVAGYRHMLRPEVYGQARMGAVGIHPGLLPKYRGSYPLWWALWNGEPEAGVTLYELGPGIDDGPVIAQATIPIDRRDTFERLYRRVGYEAAELLETLIEHLVDEGMMPTASPQDAHAATTFRTPPRWKRAVLKARLGLQAWSFMVPLMLSTTGILAMFVTLGPAVTGQGALYVPIASLALVCASLWLTYQMVAD